MSFLSGRLYSRDPGETTSWGRHFGPMMSMGDAEVPGRSLLNQAMIEYWAGRAREAQHPALKARYADAAWDLGTLAGLAKGNHLEARLAIDSYIAASSMEAEPIARRHGLERALHLALK